MCQLPLFETIALIDGKAQNLQLHQNRMQNSLKELFKQNLNFDLQQILKQITLTKGLQRLRIDYNATNFAIQITPYQPRKIQSFELVFVENFDYSHKFSDRSKLENLKSSTADEIIIVNNGKISDCTIGNLLFLKNNKWFSSQNYLLKGTQLSFLLLQNKIRLVEITPKDLKQFDKIMLINALNPFDLNRAIAIEKIYNLGK